MASGPITSWETDREIVETVSYFFGDGAPKSVQMVPAAMKLKDAYSLEEMNSASFLGGNIIIKYKVCLM